MTTASLSIKNKILRTFAPVLLVVSLTPVAAFATANGETRQDGTLGPLLLASHDRLK